MIWGDRDDVTPLAQANDLRSLIPSASLQILRNVGHIPQIEDPDAFNDVLLSAIRAMMPADTATSRNNSR